MHTHLTPHVHLSIVCPAHLAKSHPHILLTSLSPSWVSPHSHVLICASCPPPLCLIPHVSCPPRYVSPLMLPASLIRSQSGLPMHTLLTCASCLSCYVSSPACPAHLAMSPPPHVLPTSLGPGQVSPTHTHLTPHVCLSPVHLGHFPMSPPPHIFPTSWLEVGRCTREASEQWRCD